MPNSNQEKPTQVPRCRTPGHRRHKAGCASCKAYSSYYWALLRWERTVGISRGNVSAEPVRQHLQDLLKNGNRRQWDIAEESGIGRDLVNLIANGRRQTVTEITATTLLAIKPASAPAPPQRDMVPAYEGRRTLRGLAAQGWTNPTVGDLMGGTSTHATHKMMNDPSPWMLPETLDRIRAVARLLGDKDIRDEKRPGMDVRTMNNAIKRGWAPLWAWEGRDIADPDATPADTRQLHLVDPPEDDLDPADAPYVDTMMLARVRKTAEKLNEIAADGSKRKIGWVDPIGRTTRLEKYVIVSYSRRLGMTLAEVATMLGYSKTEVEIGQRIVTRLESDLKVATTWIAGDPAGETPDWWYAATDTIKFEYRLPALLAMLPEPIGPGWDLAELAKRCGVAEDEMRDFVAHAVRAGDRPWEARTTKPACAA